MTPQNGVFGWERLEIVAPLQLFVVASIPLAAAVLRNAEVSAVNNASTAYNYRTLCSNAWNDCFICNTSMADAVLRVSRTWL